MPFFSARNRPIIELLVLLLVFFMVSEVAVGNIVIYPSIIFNVILVIVVTSIGSYLAGRYHPVYGLPVAWIGFIVVALLDLAAHGGFRECGGCEPYDASIMIVFYIVVDLFFVLPAAFIGYRRGNRIRSFQNPNA